MGPLIFLDVVGDRQRISDDEKDRREQARTTYFEHGVKKYGALQSVSISLSHYECVSLRLDRTRVSLPLELYNTKYKSRLRE
mmetsp:Transcript_27841/g.75752  ORF Transcript_27841/g.75752 Transcript_27841/m.75752 type:complete len:82 (-) Transcript_27841:164-409(-)